MGVKARQRPARLAEKLLQIRVGLGLSQNELIRRLGLELTQNRISDYELGNGEPSLLVILEYARVAGVHVEDLIDDKVDLPDKLRVRVRHRT
jgi:transcriptional regulator with XRE-family HTH domain